MDKILSQEEIDALLRGMSDGQVATTPEEKDESGVITYDLANQDRIIQGRMPTLEIINDNFSRLFRNSLSLSLRKIIDVGSKGVQMMKFGEFVRTLPVPSSLHVFKMEPLRGHAILVLDSKLIFTLVDIFLGGSGKTKFRVEGREFTAIESKLIRKVVNMVFVDLEKAWNTVHPIAVRHVRSEINPQFVSIVPPSDLVIMISFGLELEQFTGLITLCIPYSIIEPIKGKLYSGYQSDHLEIDHSWIERFSERLRSIEVEVVVELGRRNIMVQDLLKLNVGDVLMLENEVANFMTAKVEGVPKFLGKAGVLGGNKAFQVEEKIKSV
jgi:flagellar motor switch protein FliM